MATLTKSRVGFGLLLFYAITCVSSSQHSGILSNLYKKAAEEHRPLILVLDKSISSNALTGKSKGSDYYSPKHLDLPKLHNYPSKSYTSDNSEISLLLKQLGYGSSTNKNQVSSSRDRYFKSRSRSGNRDKTRLRSRPEEDDHIYRDKREDRRDTFRDDRIERDRRDRNRSYRERLYQSRYYNNRHDHDRYDKEELDRQDKNKYDRYRARADGRNRARHYREIRDRSRLGPIRNYLDKPDHTRHDRDRRDRNRDVRDNRNRPRSENSYKTFLERNFKDATDKGRETMQERALRTSVVKNFLQYSNELNCDALDECAKECDDTYEPVEANDCVNECDTQFECEDLPLYQLRTADVEGCDFADSCADSTQDEINPSTRGILLEDIKEDETKNSDDDDCIAKETC